MSNRRTCHDGKTRSLDTLRILCVEDEEPVRTRLVAILRRRVGTVYSAANGQEGLAIFSAHRPDIVLSDIHMPIMNGLDMARHIKSASPSTPIIIATAFSDVAYLLQAIDAGISKYVIKPIDMERLTDALCKCAEKLEAREAAAFGDSSEPDILTRREAEILNLLARGFSTAEVAKLVCLSFHTVVAHIKKIYRKLSVNSRSEALYEAKARGLLDRRVP